MENLKCTVHSLPYAANEGSGDLGHWSSFCRTLADCMQDMEGPEGHPRTRGRGTSIRCPSWASARTSWLTLPFLLLRLPERSRGWPTSCYPSLVVYRFAWISFTLRRETRPSSSLGCDVCAREWFWGSPRGLRNSLGGLGGARPIPTQLRRFHLRKGLQLKEAWQPLLG